jgi:YD repeat-containing protein
LSEYSYDDEGRLDNLLHTIYAETTITVEYDYTYNAAGQLIEQSDHGENYEYAYDATGQLIDDDFATYSFDAGGNRDYDDYDVGTANQLSTDGTWDYDYDEEGNLIKKSQGEDEETWTSEYDPSLKASATTAARSPAPGASGRGGSARGTPYINSSTPG